MHHKQYFVKKSNLPGLNLDHIYVDGPLLVPSEANLINI